MMSDFLPLQLLLATFAGWLNRHQAQVIEYLVEENRDLADSRRQKLDLEVAAILPVRGNERLLREAVVNYISNALKYTQEGGHISVRGREIDGRVRVEVEDDGPGIAPADQALLFAEFQRLAQAGDGGSDAPPGTGLGLSIVRRVVEVHGGSVGVESHPGEGSLFYLELPAAR